MRSPILVILAVCCYMFAFPPPKAKAIDPITMAILAPVALEVANAARPYVIRGIVNAGKGFFKIGKATFEMLYLPWGFLELTFGLPFKKARRGIVHVVRGGVIAPAKIFVHTLLMPVYIVGVQVNM
ncbi:MAG: hypothetical protein J6W00_12855 [Lentisphaeria bacterium]|nr:hypothetical protein [Lentisphaeria bacterium]